MKKFLKHLLTKELISTRKKILAVGLICFAVFLTYFYFVIIQEILPLCMKEIEWDGENYIPFVSEISVVLIFGFFMMMGLFPTWIVYFIFVFAEVMTSIITQRKTNTLF